MSNTSWVKVQRGGPWRPSDVGQVLEGVYCGVVTIPAGVAGGDRTFEAVSVRTHDGMIHIVGGVIPVALVRESGLIVGDRLRLKYTGEQSAKASGHPMRTFDLYVPAA